MDQVQAASVSASGVKLRRVARFPKCRVLTWDGDVLYAARGYDVIRLRAGNRDWELVAGFRPVWWRALTSRTRLSYRLVRDGFHALAVLKDGTMIGAVPGAIVTRVPEQRKFTVTHRLLHGTRPLHIAATPGTRIYWGEYFDNRERAEVHIYVSEDRGLSWHVGYTFPAGSVRHVHNVVHDRWADVLWILTGDEGAECQILRASLDLRAVEPVISGNQQARAVALVPTRDALYLSTDTPHEQNHVYRLDRSSARLDCVGDLRNSSIYGCRVSDAIFFSTMVEPSVVNTTPDVDIVGSQGRSWNTLLRWKKDHFSKKYFQYGNAMLPDGENDSNILAVTTIAVEQDDLVTTLWEVESGADA
jgi:hypothetical protein